jgi:hypothetical protein
MADEESSGRAVQVAPGGLLREPRSLLYSVDARIGGYGRNLNAHESFLLADERGYLGKAIGYDNLQRDISPRYITSLHWHPVRLLSREPPALYDDAKKKYVDWAASRQLKSQTSFTDFSDERELPSLAQFEGPSINVAGFLSCVDEVFRQSDLHIFPSECEGSPKSLYEACACGLPQITTFESGDVVLTEVNGLIVPPNDVVALADAIRRLYHSPQRILEYGRAARQRAEAEFTWDHFRERLARAYDFVLRQRSTP